MDSFTCRACNRPIAVTQWRNHTRGEKHKLAVDKMMKSLGFKVKKRR